MTIDLHQKIDGKIVDSPARVFSFPGGEQHIKYAPGDFVGEQIAVVRGANANDYVAAQMWADCVYNQGGNTTLVVPYLPGARADRGIPMGAAHYGTLVALVAAEKAVFFDAHSSVMPQILEDMTEDLDTGTRYSEVHPYEVIETVLGNFRPDFVIAPDKGAVDRAELVAAHLEVQCFYARKTRDFETGKLSGFECDPIPETGHGLIVDDICDGGGTFLGLTKHLEIPRERISLYVSHGIFSGNHDQNVALGSAFDTIYTTDSHPGAIGHRAPANVIAHDALKLLEAWV